MPFSFWSALYQRDNAQQIWLNVYSAIILIFFLQFFSSFLIWSTSDLSHKTHISSFSSDPLLTFLPSSLGCIFICFLFLHLNYQTVLYKKNYHLLWVCSNLKEKGRAIIQLTACFVSGWIDEMYTSWQLITLESSFWFQQQLVLSLCKKLHYFSSLLLSTLCKKLHYFSSLLLCTLCISKVVYSKLERLHWNQPLWVVLTSHLCVKGRILDWSF